MEFTQSDSLSKKVTSTASANPSPTQPDSHLLDRYPHPKQPIPLQTETTQIPTTFLTRTQHPTPPHPTPPILPFPISLSASTRACECCFAKSNSWASIWLIPAIQPISVSQEAVVYHAGINWDWRAGLRLRSRTDKLSLILAARDSFTGRKKSSFLILLAKYPIPSCGSDSLKTLSRSGPMRVVCYSLAEASMLPIELSCCWSQYSDRETQHKDHVIAVPVRERRTTTPALHPPSRISSLPPPGLPHYHRFFFSSFLRKRAIL